LTQQQAEELFESIGKSVDERLKKDRLTVLIGQEKFYKLKLETIGKETDELVEYFLKKSNITTNKKRSPWLNKVLTKLGMVPILVALSITSVSYSSTVVVNEDVMIDLAFEPKQSLTCKLLHEGCGTDLYKKLWGTDKGNLKNNYGILSTIS